MHKHLRGPKQFLRSVCTLLERWEEWYEPLKRYLPSLPRPFVGQQCSPFGFGGLAIFFLVLVRLVSFACCEACALLIAEEGISGPTTNSPAGFQATQHLITWLLHKNTDKINPKKGIRNVHVLLFANHASFSLYYYYFFRCPQVHLPNSHRHR